MSAHTGKRLEIKMLQTIYGAEVECDAQRKVTSNMVDTEIQKMFERAISEEVRAAERAGQDGVWCYFCGAASVELHRCDCGLAESFRCGASGRLVCNGCREAHRSVAGHLETIFAAPPVVRVNSRRAQRSRELSLAARACYREDIEPVDCPLFSGIAQCDEFERDSERLRKDLLRSFAKAKFLDFQTLARNLKKQQDESFIRAAIRSGLFR